MLDTSNLSAFLKGITDAIRAKKGTTNTIEHKLIDEEIASISSGGGNDSDIVSLILDACASNSDYSSFFYNSSITDEQLAHFVNEFPNKLGKQTSSIEPKVNKLFYGCKNLTTIPVNSFYVTPAGMNGSQWFDGCDNLESIYVPLRMFYRNAYFSYATSVFPTASTSNDTLKEIRIATNGIINSISFAYYHALSKESYDSIISGLKTVTTAATLTVYYNVSLTNEQIANITSKGWTLALGA